MKILVFLKKLNFDDNVSMILEKDNKEKYIPYWKKK